MRRLMALMAGTALLGGIVAGVASASDASGDPQSCPSGKLCVWENADYEGRRFDFEFTNDNWHSGPNRDIADHDSSWYNNGTPGVDTVCVYPEAGFGGKPLRLLRGERIAYAGEHNDRGSSNKWVSTNTPCPQ